MAADPQPAPRGPFTISVSLGSIPIEIEPSFWLVGLIMGSRAGWEGALAWTGVLLVSILLHELGHALAAMSFGSKVHIRLYSLGGLTYHGRLNRGPAILTSLAGPFAGFLLGGGLYLYEH
ncbi:MAG: M50 family metallopeptidase, partial [Myxococcaceae bacterium]